MQQASMPMHSKTHSHPRRSKMVLPSWIVKAIITTLITLLLGGAAAWSTQLTTWATDHEKRIAVVEDHQLGIDKKLDNIDKKLDRLLERRPYGARPTQ